MKNRVCATHIERHFSSSKTFFLYFICKRHPINFLLDLYGDILQSFYCDVTHKEHVFFIARFFFLLAYGIFIASIELNFNWLIMLCVWRGKHFLAFRWRFLLKHVWATKWFYSQYILVKWIISSLNYFYYSQRLIHDPLSTANRWMNEWFRKVWNEYRTIIPSGTRYIAKVIFIKLNASEMWYRRQCCWVWVSVVWLHYVHNFKRFKISYTSSESFVISYCLEIALFSFLIKQMLWKTNDKLNLVVSMRAFLQIA